MAHKTAHWHGQPLTLDPIGLFRSPFKERAEAPRQATVAADIEGRVELFAGRGFEDALSDLDLFDHVWLVFWFDRNEGYRPKVMPPRSSVKRGVFATRAPYRPNPIGLSAVKLVKVDGLTVHVRGVDLLEGTPIVDIKPYVPYCDAIPEASHGWLESEARRGQGTSDPLAEYRVSFGVLAQEQLDYLLTEHNVALETRILEVLRLGPTPHAYRRIRREEQASVLALKDWRVRFTTDEKLITVTSIHSGYRPNQLFAEPPRAPLEHRAFVAKWSTLLP